MSSAHFLPPWLHRVALKFNLHSSAGDIKLRQHHALRTPESRDIVLYLAGVNEHAALRIVGNKRWRVSHLLWTIQFFSTMEFTSWQLKATFAISWRDDGPNAQPCKLRTYGLCLQVSEHRTQGQDSERKSSNFRLDHPPSGGTLLFAT